jgi:hypothetical protein
MNNIWFEALDTTIGTMLPGDANDGANGAIDEAKGNAEILSEHDSRASGE